MDSIPFRAGWWNIPIALRVVFFMTMAIAIGILVYGAGRRIRLWKQGQPEAGFDRPWQRLWRTLKYGVAQVRIVRQRFPAVMHLAVFWTMSLLLVGTILASLDTDVFEVLFHSKLLRGDFYLVYKVILDLAALALLLGLVLAIIRRYVFRPERLNTDWRFNLTLPLLVFIALTGLMVEALRLAATQPVWATWSVVGYPMSHLFAGLSGPTLLVLHRSIWIVHYLGVGVFFATLPWTNLFHVFSSPANIFVAPFRIPGALHPITDLEAADSLGASRLSDFPWPRLVNLDACTECGRCQAVCPAYAAEQPLNPKQVVLDLRAFMSGDEMSAQSVTQVEQRGNATALRAMVGDVITPDVLWSCTTCYACVYECPVLIEQVDDIVDMRRYLALMEGALPASLAASLANIERSGNPWKQSRKKRMLWTDGLDFEVPVMANVKRADVLWWVGCAGAYDPRNQQVSRALAKILRAAGVDFAVLGDEEQCTGDAARRAGNEYLFQKLAQANIETLNKYQFQAIVTQCPHCYNTLLHEYPQFGGAYRVVHHTRFIQDLLDSGKIELESKPPHPATFHDPCYLGRYNGEYNAPRRSISASGRTIVEMKQSRASAMCCGGGGSRVWMEDEGAVRINYNRIEQIAATGASEVGVACPFCIIMLEDARGAKGLDSLVIHDVAEIVAGAIASH